MRTSVAAATWRALGVLGVLGALGGCEPAAPAADRQPAIVALGPVHADVSGRRLEVGFAVWDAEADAVPLALSWCDAAAGQSCALDTCTATGIATTVRGQPDRLELTLEALTWKLACGERVPSPDRSFTLCLRTTDSAAGAQARESTPLSLAAFDASPAGRAGAGPLPPETCP